MQRTIIGERYVLLDSLGRGGMGKVYRAHDELLDREVALKLLRTQHAENSQFAERFRRETKNAAALSHPNIVSVFDGGESSDGTPYMAMEYVGGGTLAERVEKNGPLDALEAVGIALQVACALEEAHEKGVIHRDIKPHNIFLVEAASSTATGVGFGGLAPGDVKVGDFGIARAAAETAMTETSLILGTVRYLSPEQATGEEVGPESDLYSLGVVLYEMLTGEVPFDAENPIAIAMKHISDPPPLPREKNPGVPENIQTVTLRLLSKAPEDRYATAGELIEDLERVGRGLPPVNVPVGDETEVLERIPQNSRARRPAGRRRIVSPRRSRAGRRLGVLAVLAVLAGVLVFAGTGGGLSALYENLDAQGVAQPVNGMRDVQTPSAVEAPTVLVDVPGVVDRGEEEAERILRDAGFEVEKATQESSAREEGTVIFQDPPPDTRVQRGSQVTITVAEAPATATVPDLTGSSPLEAEARLSEAGLFLGQQSEASSDSMPAGLILGQEVVAGTEVLRETTVSVTVSTGPEPVVIPEPDLVSPAPEEESAPQEPENQEPQDSEPQEPQGQDPAQTPSGPPSGGTSQPAPEGSNSAVPDTPDPIEPSMPDMPDMPEVFD